MRALSLEEQCKIFNKSFATQYETVYFSIRVSCMFTWFVLQLADYFDLFLELPFALDLWKLFKPWTTFNMSLGTTSEYIFVWHFTYQGWGREGLKKKPFSSTNQLSFTWVCSILYNIRWTLQEPVHHCLKDSSKNVFISFCFERISQDPVHHAKNLPRTFTSGLAW